MASFWGDLNLSDVLAASKSIGANIKDFEDREVQKKKDAIAEKRASAQETRSQESHDMQMAAIRRTENLEKSNALLAQAKVADNKGDKNAVLKLAAEAQNYSPDGVDLFNGVDMSSVDPYTKEEFYAQNPELKSLEGSEAIFRGYDMLQDRDTHVGFKNTKDLLETWQAGLNPQAYMKKEANLTATVDEFNSKAEPVASIDSETGETKFYIDRMIINEDGKPVKESIPLTKDQAEKYKGGISTTAANQKRAFDRAKAKEDLEMEAKRTTIGKDKALTLKAKALAGKATREGKAAGAITREVRKQAYDIVKDHFDMLYDADKAMAIEKFEELKPYIEQALERGGGSVDIVNIAKDLKRQYEEAQKVYAEDKAAAAKGAKESQSTSRKSKASYGAKSLQEKGAGVASGASPKQDLFVKDGVVWDRNTSRRVKTEPAQYVYKYMKDSKGKPAGRKKVINPEWEAFQEEIKKLPKG